MQSLKRSDPRASFRRIYFTCVDAAALQTRLQSSDMSTFTLKMSKNGSTSLITPAGTPVQVDATNAKGLFYLELTAAEIDTPPEATLIVTNTGGTKTMERREIAFRVEPAVFATVVAGLNTTSFTTDRTETSDNYWKDVYVSVLTGALAGQVKKIGAYAGSSKMFTLAAPGAFTDVLGAGDIVELINR